MKKMFAVLLVALLVLTGCGSKNNVTLVDEYNYVFSKDIQSLDYTLSMRATDADHTQNFVDGLLELDNLGHYIPAIATELPTVSDDGLTYTFKIREGVKWVTNTGEERGNVTAHDFVYGLKHAIENKSQMLFIAQSIKGVSEYYKDKSFGFENVGVKATDDYTLVYTLNNPESFFTTKLNYGIFMPVNEEFVKSVGVKNFGTIKPDSILYNGPYLLTDNTAGSSLQFAKNDNYWDEGNVFVKKVKLTYFTGDNPGELYDGFVQGNFTAARVYPNNPHYDTVKKDHGDNIIFSPLNGVVFNFNWNLNRRTFDTNKSKTDEQKDSTHKAILNQDFRLAVMHAFDRKAYNSQSVGAEAAAATIRNDFMPPSFISVDGIDYPATVIKELEAINPRWKGTNLADGQDAFYNPDKAKEYAATAKTALEAEGVKFPVIVDLPFMASFAVGVDQVKSFKKSVEDSLGADFITVNLIELDDNAYYAATYDSEVGKTSDFDITNASGWGPDYGDPSTYLNIYNTKTGDMLHVIGLDRTDAGETDESKAEREAVGLLAYDALLDAANAEFHDTKTRMELFAKADAWFVDSAIQIPTHGQGGTPSVTKVVPFTKAYGWTGNGDQRFKFMKIQDQPITVKQYEKAKADWEKARAK